MKGIRRLLLVSMLFVGMSPQVFADPFIEGSEDSSSRFHGHLDDFSRSLGDAGQRMRESYDYSANQQSQRNLADQMSVQQGTQAMAQQEFQKGMMQQSTMSSGGFINNGGLFGSGLGVVPMGNPASTGLNVVGVPAYPNQRGVVYVPVPVPVPAQSNHWNNSGGLFSDDLFATSSTRPPVNSRAAAAMDPNWKDPVPVPVTTLHKHSIPGFSSSNSGSTASSSSSSGSQSASSSLSSPSSFTIK